jgi:hypothetical protein
MSPIELRPIRLVAAVPQLTVRDLVRAAEYYREIFGFHIAGYWDDQRLSHTADTPRVFAIVWRDQVQLCFNRADLLDLLGTIVRWAAPTTTNGRSAATRWRVWNCFPMTTPKRAGP